MNASKAKIKLINKELFLLEWVRSGLCKLFKRIIKYSPFFLKRKFVQIPFSRFSKLLVYFFNSKHNMQWYRTNIEVNPSAYPDYYLYFFNYSENHEIDKLIYFCKNANIFVDIGANKGFFSLAIASVCPGIEVFAFEPDSRVASYFKKNLNLNKNLIDKINIIENAVADKDKDVFFQQSKDIINKNFPGVTGKISNEKTSALVPCVCLDSFFDKKEKYPDVIKIDVEGMEYAVLRGMDTLFSKGFPKIIMLEVHSFSHSDPLRYNKKIKDFLEKKGYYLSQLKKINGKPLM